jgi:hypothetical protein
LFHITVAFTFIVEIFQFSKTEFFLLQVASTMVHGTIREEVAGVTREVKGVAGEVQATKVAMDKEVVRVTTY